MTEHVMADDDERNAAGQPGWVRGWYREDDRRHYNAVADRLVYLGTEDGPVVVDRYDDPEQPGEVQRMLTVRPGVTVLAARPWTDRGWAALAWETDPADEPRQRLLEALLEGHLRAWERMGGVGLARHADPTGAYE